MRVKAGALGLPALAVSMKKSYMSVNLRSHTIRIESGPLGTRSFLLARRAMRAARLAWNGIETLGQSRETLSALI
jgi:hypothetical protein